MCVCACTHVRTHTCPRVYLIQSHATKSQATSTSARRLAEALLVVGHIKGVTNLRVLC